MLVNPFYYGVFIHKGEMHQGSHEPIITKQLFDEVQKIHKAKRNTRTKKELLPFAFRGVFTCGECGRTITAERKKKPSGLRYTYYRCTKKNVVCSQKFLEERKLINQINKIIKSVALPDVWKDKMLKRVDQEIKEIHTKHHSEIQALKNEQTKLETKLLRLLDERLDQSISKEVFAKAKQKIVNRQVEIKELLDNFERKGDTRLELFKNWILAAHQAHFISAGDNLEYKRNFIQKIGSNFRLAGQKALISLSNPWLCAQKKSEFSDWSG